MPIIVTTPAGSSGGGDATAANQSTQIAQLQQGAGSPSVLKNVAGNSVFKDDFDNRLLLKSNVILGGGVTDSIAFTDTTLAGLNLQIQTWIIANNNVYLMKFCHSISATEYTAIIIFQLP